MRAQRLSSRRRGFTISEVLVVVLIIAILMVIAVPHYIKTSEQSKADQAQALLAMIASDNRMRNLDHYAYAVGTVDNTSALVTEQYLKHMDWAALAYDFKGADDPASCVIARATRKTTGSRGTSSAVYSK